MQDHLTIVRRLFWLVACATTCSLMLASSTVAQAYRFRVPEMKLQAYIQDDASVKLVYDITFENMPNGDAIDIVDIGLPHARYLLHTATASTDRAPIHEIRKSAIIDIGVELHLGGHSIKPGQKGWLHFECVVADMVYSDTTDADFASFQIRPTWFDPSCQVGTTNFQLAVHCLPGVAAEALRYQDRKAAYAEVVMYGENENKHAVAVWNAPTLQLSASNPKFSLSFPRTGMKRVIQQSALELLVKWFEERPMLRRFSLIAMLLVFVVTFLRFSHGTGIVLMIAMACMIGLVSVGNSAIHLLGWPFMILLVAVNEWSLRKRKSTYLPAMATVEGGGIKRGLTAPQAAILLEMPLGKVVSMVLFGLIKKGVLAQVSGEPFTVRVGQLYADKETRIRTAADRGIVIHDYEEAFIDALQDYDGPTEKCDMTIGVKELIASTTGRMKGFDLKITREYYLRIVERAWTEAKSVGEFKGRTEAVDRNFEWMMIDPDWTDVFDEWGRDGYDYYPRWNRFPRHPSTGGSSGRGGGGQSGDVDTPTPGAETSLGEVASSFAGWTEVQSGRLADAFDPSALTTESSAGILDLSSIDRITADVFQALAESSGGGGGGGGGGCACACAGCACACACAGGGR